MVLDKIRLLRSKESYSPAVLFDVKKLIGEKEGVPELSKRKELVVDRGVVHQGNSEEEVILNFLIKGGGRMGATDLLNHCLSNNVCSRATFFRRVRDLQKNNLLKKVKEGRKSFYQILE